MINRDGLGHACSGADAAIARALRIRLCRLSLLHQRPAGRRAARAGRQPRDDDGPRAGGLPEPARHRAGRALRRRARRCRARCRCRPTNARRCTCAPSAHLANGRWHAAGLVLEDLSIRYPLRSAGAAGRAPGRLLHRPLAHAARSHRARRQRVAPRHARATTRCWACTRSAWKRPATTRAPRRSGRRAVGLEPRDGWAWHAVAHVMEMQDRRRDGVAWLEPSAETWSDGSFFAIHNWWHLALFHLDLDEIDEVLKLVDARILGTRIADRPGDDRCVGAAVAAAAARHRRRHALAGAGRALVAAGRGRQLRLQRPARDDGLRRRRPHKPMPHACSPRRRARCSSMATTRSFCATWAVPPRRRCTRSAAAVMPRRCNCCARCAARPTASAAATRSAT